jgi:Tfp pilus assembly PilM family ATPase
LERSFFLTSQLADVDMGDDALKLVQLAPACAGLFPLKRENEKGAIVLVAGGSENRPADVKPGSGDWQRWAIEAVRRMTANGKFRGRNIVAQMPASEVFIDHLKKPKVSDDKLADAIFSKVKKKLPFESDEAIMKYIPAEEDNVVVIANQREKIDRHLAIYEEANMQLKSMGVWPIALINSYITFFGRRKADVEATVCLLDIETNCANVVICRHKNLLFARSIPIGAKQLDAVAEHGKRPQADEMTRLLLELTACMRHFSSMYRKAQIERLVFLSGRAVDKDICTAIAEQLDMPAQMGDCLAAVEIPVCQDGLRIDRRGRQVNWAAAFGLSLWGRR